MKMKLALAAHGVLLFTLAAGSSGCRQNSPVAAGGDPATGNLAPVDPNAPQQFAGTSSVVSSTSTQRQSARVLGQQMEAPPPTVNGQAYPQNEASNYSQAAPAGAVDDQNYAYNAQYEDEVNAGQDALDAQAVYADQAPPPLPVYDQPVLTEPGDQWTPGYWAYASTGYYWVPGAWVAPPYAGALWTPPYWGYYNHRYGFHHGFWGRYIGFYGGIPYGFGYTGVGYYGGYWRGRDFYYNRQVNRVNVDVVRNVYIHEVPRYNTNIRVSFNGPGGWNARPQAAEMAAYREQRFPPMQSQIANLRAAQSSRQQFFAENHGRPAIAVAQQRLVADRAPAQTLRTGGFGQQGAQQRGFQAGQQPQQQRGFTQNPQQRGFEPGQQQHGSIQEPQRGMIQNQQAFHNQQAEQMRNQQIQSQQHGMQTEQFRNQQLQQRNEQIQNQQRGQQNEQFRNRQLEQRGRQVEDQQRNQQLQQTQQRAQQNQQLQQQRTMQNQQVEQQRSQQAEQQRNLQNQAREQQQNQQRAVQQQQLQNQHAIQQQRTPIQPQQMQRPQVEQQRIQPQRMEQPHVQQPQPQQRIEQPRVQQAPQQHVEQPRPQAAPHPQANGGAPHGGGGEHHR